MKKLFKFLTMLTLIFGIIAAVVALMNKCGLLHRTYLTVEEN